MTALKRKDSEKKKASMIGCQLGNGQPYYQSIIILAMTTS
jgi:hypothetical protein